MKSPKGRLSEAVGSEEMRALLNETWFWDLESCALFAVESGDCADLGEDSRRSATGEEFIGHVVRDRNRQGGHQEFVLLRGLRTPKRAVNHGGGGLSRPGPAAFCFFMDRFGVARPMSEGGLSLRARAREVFARREFKKLDISHSP